jgi:hypothetical protein
LRTNAGDPRHRDAIRNRPRQIELKRRSVQSYVEIGLFPLDESGSPSAVNNRFRNYRVRDSVRNEVGNEASWLVVIKGLSQYAKSAKVLVIVTAETTMEQEILSQFRSPPQTTSCTSRRILW